MDPVQYLLHLIEQGVSYEDARSHTRHRFGINDADLDLRLRIARKDANALMRSLDALPREAWGGKADRITAIARDILATPYGEDSFIDECDARELATLVLGGNV